MRGISQPVYLRLSDDRSGSRVCENAIVSRGCAISYRHQAAASTNDLNTRRVGYRSCSLSLRYDVFTQPRSRAVIGYGRGYYSSPMFILS